MPSVKYVSGSRDTALLVIRRQYKISVCELSRQQSGGVVVVFFFGVYRSGGGEVNSQTIDEVVAVR